MDRAMISEAVGGIDGKYITEALDMGTVRRTRTARRLRRTALIAAALLMALTATGLACGVPITVREDKAVDALNAELDKLCALGVLTEPFHAGSDASVRTESNGYSYFSFLSDGNPFYTISYSGEGYRCIMSLDAVTGKLIACTVNDREHGDMEPVRTVPWENGTMEFYNDFSQIPEELTVSGLCEIMGDYLGFVSFEAGECDTGLSVSTPLPEDFLQRGLRELAETADNTLIIQIEYKTAGGETDRRYISASDTGSGSYYIFGVGHPLG